MAGMTTLMMSNEQERFSGVEVCGASRGAERRIDIEMRHWNGHENKLQDMN